MKPVVNCTIADGGNNKSMATIKINKLIFFKRLTLEYFNRSDLRQEIDDHMYEPTVFFSLRPLIEEYSSFFDFYQTEVSPLIR
jgi:hypothetical protein